MHRCRLCSCSVGLFLLSATAALLHYELSSLAGISSLEATAVAPAYSRPEEEPSAPPDPLQWQDPRGQEEGIPVQKSGIHDATSNSGDFSDEPSLLLHDMTYGEHEQSSTLPLGAVSHTGDSTLPQSEKPSSEMLEALRAQLPPNRGLNTRDPRRRAAAAVSRAHEAVAKLGLPGRVGGSSVRAQAAAQQARVPSQPSVKHFPGMPAASLTGRTRPEERVTIPDAPDPSDSLPVTSLSAEELTAAQNLTMEDPALLLICFDRPDYLRRTIGSLSSLSRIGELTVYISQDGHHEGVNKVAASAVTLGGPLGPPHTRGARHLHHPRDNPAQGVRQPGHAWLSQHYKWALESVFAYGHSHVITVEDDMEFSADFLELFWSTAWLFRVDSSLICVSSWNDYGFAKWKWHPSRLMRTSFFPGLGWMTSKAGWLAIRRVFPDSNWDNDIRAEGYSRGWECIVPEVNRNHNFGEKGANMDTRLYHQLIEGMKHYTGSPNHTFFSNISYLVPGSTIKSVQQEIWGAEVINWRQQEAVLLQITRAPETSKSYVALYSARDFKRLAKKLSLGHDSPRLNFRGVTRLPLKKKAVLLLINEQTCRFLPDRLKAKPPASLKIATGKGGQACNEVCHSMSWRCQERGFDYINNCATLYQQFNCAGCGLELGDDLPAQIAQSRNPSFQRCVVSVGRSTCSARSKASARMCPCVPE